MKIGNIMPRVGIEPTSLAFQAIVLTITPPRLPDVAILPTPTFPYGCLPERSVQTTEVQLFLTENTSPLKKTKNSANEKVKAIVAIAL